MIERSLRHHPEKGVIKFSLPKHKRWGALLKYDSQ